MPKIKPIIDSTEFTSRFVTLKVGTSKAADTWGYTRVVASDTRTGQKFVTTGGGYDMTGTVLAEWAMAHVQDRLDKLTPESQSVGPYPHKLYGIHCAGHPVGAAGKPREHAYLDGGCGHSSVIEVLAACGVTATLVYDRSTRNSKLIGWDISLTPATTTTSTSTTTSTGA